MEARGRTRAALIGLACVVIGALSLPAPASAQGTAPTAGPDARYALANGCYSLRSSAAGRVVAKSGGGYTASVPQVAGGEPFYLKPTELGQYMLYGAARDYLARNSAGDVAPAADSGPDADWTVTVQGNSFRLALGDRVLSVDGAGKLVLTGSPGAGSQFSMEKASGCAQFPEVETGVTGAPSKGSTAYAETAGFLEAHMHGMAFEFLGGKAHCGKPWSRWGVEKALVDCPDHGAGQGGAAVLENVLSYNSPLRTHDPVGWPTFKDWPAAKSLTHEQSYYKWLERSWRAGQRVFVNLLVENKVLCEAYPFKQNSCDEMDAVRLQARRMREMENYIDAQAGGPGKGFYRIVTDPYQARRVINEGKLAVIMGIEVSEPFGCQVYNDQPQCDRADIDRELDEAYRLGVRQMEIINKFDNALAGVAGDSGTTGVVVNNGNKLTTGKYWQMQACTGPPDEVDRQQTGLYDHDHNDLLSNAIENLLPMGVAPVYPRGANCNARGLTDLGEHLVGRLMSKRMIIDPDHLSVRARKSLLTQLEAKRYSGVVSSHSWSTPDVVPRIYNLGGVITPYAGDSKSFVQKYRETAPKANRGKYYFGFGYGADMNGFGAQGNARNGPNPVTYPFKSWDGKQTIAQQKSGVRLFDINKDGVAHYGLYPDWIEDLRKQAGDGIVRDMARGSEAYLQMWERAEGVRNQACRSARGQFTSAGMGRQRLGAGAASVLQRAGQPNRRIGRVFRWCVTGRGNKGTRLSAVFDRRGRVALLASNALGHGTIGRRKGGKRVRISRGAPARLLRGRAKRIGGGLYVRRAAKGKRFVYKVRKGRVRYVAVASRTAAKNGRTLRAYLKLSGVR